jgi:hypothetical protein
VLNVIKKKPKEKKEDEVHKNNLIW